ncbi:energy transducer TonB [Desulfobacula sp.]|uniref:energy transducer TonB n=1 Tax=Desulfobacula sp. TaxID=2593537 RepID=UPI002617FE22|nr:energy transducer TonB [Desulfobacula sp.]
MLIFMHMAGICRTEALTYIEIGIKDISKPVERLIPRPRTRQNPIYKIPKMDTINIAKQNIPPIKINRVKTSLSDTLMESIKVPDLPFVPEQSNINISDFKSDNVSDFLTKNDYFDMLRLKIESNKKYPDTARLKYIEGRVEINFIIAKDGRISDLKIVKPARHNSLNKAALKAVKDSAPFSVPPSNLFKESLKIEITIVFEIT